MSRTDDTAANSLVPPRAFWMQRNAAVAGVDGAAF
jgi:hypothetical protein